ncbi:MAG: SRPBCC family protein [Desulfobacteraceae bacterium]
MRIEHVTTQVQINLSQEEDLAEIAENAYAFICDMVSFPNYMADVLKVEEKRSGTKSIVSWECLIDGVPFNWVQENTYDGPSFVIFFELLEGDFELFEGSWNVEKHHNQVNLGLNLRYAIGLPVIEEVLGPILKEKLKKNSFSMLEDIKKRLETEIA